MVDIWGFFNVYLFLRERERERERDRQTERQRETEREEADPRLCIVSTEPDAGLKPTNCKITT